MDRELAVFLWTVCHDRDFLRQYRSELDVAVLPRGPSRYLLTLALKAWEDDKAMLTPVAIEMLVETTDPKSFSTTLDEVLEVYAEAYDRYDYDEQDIGLLESIAIKWFRKQRLGLRLDEASEALEQADLEGADRALRESTRVIQPPAEGLNILDFGNASRGLGGPRSRPGSSGSTSNGKVAYTYSSLASFLRRTTRASQCSPHSSRAKHCARTRACSTTQRNSPRKRCSAVSFPPL